MTPLEDAQQLELRAYAEKDLRVKKKLYLDAAEIYVRLAHAAPQHEKVLLEKAESLFAIAKGITVSASAQKPDAFLQKIMPKKPTLRFSDVAGLADLKEKIRLKIIAPFAHPELYKTFGKSVGGGVLMYGPPGCGKSLIAEACAGEASVTFFHVKASDVKSKFVGETEQNIAKLFAAARRMQPCIVFFDEFESLGGERTSASSYDRSMVSQLLTEMDGLGTKDDQILFLAATNEPWSVDSALRRGGRFGSTLFVPPPDAAAREGIFALQLKDKPLAADVSLTILAGLCEGYSGADIAEVCNDAIEAVLSDCLTSGVVRPLQLSDFTAVLDKRVSPLTAWFDRAVGIVHRRGLEEQFAELVAYTAPAASENVVSVDESASGSLADLL